MAVVVVVYFSLFYWFYLFIVCFKIIYAWFKMKSSPNVFRSTDLVYKTLCPHPPSFASGSWSFGVLLVLFFFIIWDLRNEARVSILLKFDLSLILVMGFMGYEVIKRGLDMYCFSVRIEIMLWKIFALLGLWGEKNY